MITITLPLSGKEFCLDRVMDSLSRLIFPEPEINYIFLDNSGHYPFQAKIRNFTARIPSDHKVIIHTKPPGYFKTVADIYNFFSPQIKGNWFCLEDDILEYPPDILLRMYRILLSHYDLGILSTHVETRRGWPHPLAWKVEEIDGELGLRPQAPSSNEFSLVDATHTGCTLIRPTAYLNYQFKQTGPWNKIIGHDIHLCLDSKRRGIFTGVLWHSRPGHWTENGGLFPKMPHTSNLNPFAARAKNPLVTIITPTFSRPFTLKALLARLKAQTYPHFENLICSDGPDRFTARTVEEASDPRFRYYELGYPHGFSGAPQRNAMLPRSGGDLVCFIDDDANPYPDYLRTMVNLWLEGYLVGFAQIEHRNQNQSYEIIPPDKASCTKWSNLDTLCGFVDSSLAKGFFWDLFEGHDYRYYQQIISFTRGAYGFAPRVVGSSSRNYGASPSKEDTIPGLIRDITKHLTYPDSTIEPAILKDPTATLQYIMNAREGKPWPQAEKIISTNPQTALFYIKNISKGERLPDSESLFKSTPDLAVTYAKAVKMSWHDLGNFPLHNQLKKDEKYHHYDDFSTIE